MDDIDDISEIFQIVDSDGSGYLDKEKLHRICPHLSPSEIDIIFNDLDTDHDNRINLKEFTNGFKQLIKPTHVEHTIHKKKLINSATAIDKDDDDLSTDLTQVQINEVFNNLSWYEKKRRIINLCDFIYFYIDFNQKTLLHKSKFQG